MCFNSVLMMFPSCWIYLTFIVAVTSMASDAVRMEDRVRQLERELCDKTHRLEQLEAAIQADGDRQAQLETLERFEAEWLKERELLDNEREEELRLLQEVGGLDLFKLRGVNDLPDRLWKRHWRRKLNWSPRCYEMLRENPNCWTTLSGNSARSSGITRRKSRKRRNPRRSAWNEKWPLNTRGWSTTSKTLTKNLAR